MLRLQSEHVTAPAKTRDPVDGLEQGGSSPASSPPASRSSKRHALAKTIPRKRRTPLRVDNLPLFACILAKNGRLSTLVRYASGNPLSCVIFTATYLWDELEGAKEDGVGGGFAEFELVAGVELGGATGLDLNTHARGPVYHHGAVGG